MNAAQIGMRCGDKKAGSLTYSNLSDNWYVIVLPPVEEESVAARRKSRAGGCKKFPSELAFCWRQHSEVSMMVAEVPLSRPCPPRPGDYVVGPGSRVRDATFALGSACAKAGMLRAECSTCPRLCALLAP